MNDRLADIVDRSQFEDTRYPSWQDLRWLIGEVERLRTLSQDYLRSRQEFARENAQLRDRLHRCKEQLTAVLPDAAAPAEPH